MFTNGFRFAILSRNNSKFVENVLNSSDDLSDLMNDKSW